MVFTDADISALYEKSLVESREKLPSLEVAEGRKPNTRGLNGWVFEQTVRFCLSRELDALGLHPLMKEQVRLTARLH